MCSRHPEEGAGSPASLVGDGSGLDWQQTYADALKIHSEAPGTVCLATAHYERGRHPVPYRIGIVHHYRTGEEHWHSSEKDAHRCLSDWKQQELA